MDFNEKPKSFDSNQLNGMNGVKGMSVITEAEVEDNSKMDTIIVNNMSAKWTDVREIPLNLQNIFISLTYNRILKEKP